MGTWDDKPWDNDTAADWFGDLFDATELHQLDECLRLAIAKLEAMASMPGAEQLREKGSRVR